MVQSCLVSNDGQNQPANLGSYSQPNFTTLKVSVNIDHIFWGPESTAITIMNVKNKGRGPPPWGEKSPVPRRAGCVLDVIVLKTNTPICCGYFSLETAWGNFPPRYCVCFASVNLHKVSLKQSLKLYIHFQYCVGLDVRGQDSKWYLLKYQSKYQSRMIKL